MILTKKIIKFSVAGLLLFCLYNTSVYAGGFPLRPGRLIISPSVSYFFANSKWDSLGVKRPFDKNGQFTSITYSLYAEYGISRRFAFVASLPYSMNTFRQSDYNSKSNGVTDMETGIRYYLANINFKYYFSIQGTLITPLYTNPNLGYQERGGELKLSFSSSGHLFNRSFYYSFDNGFREYFGTAGPFQDRYSGAFGLTLDKKFKEQISISLGGFYSNSTNKQFNLLNPVTSKNFAFNQVALSYGHSFSKQLSLFFSAGHFITGLNTGDGLSASGSLIYKIDR